MNIKAAKQQIKNAMIAYFTKDSLGEYVIPIEKQRPVFLMGPPGVGKTAIMEQIASEMQIGLLTYSMTHHTRQSALGLPFIEHKQYGGTEYAISEYTMSEIIASVYDLMETTGVREGILFLDEINCVSETLAPVMLQFLQYKVFGKHRLPKGWIIVTAGNPPEYNNSVREFDMATWDRLKRIDVEPDYEIWNEYANQKGIHPAISTYLQLKRVDFYSIESSVDGKQFVTARGWEDLSQMLKLYEYNSLVADNQLVSQYIQNQRIARDFSIYYDLFKKYKDDYQIERILSGEANEQIKTRAKEAKFDERLSLIGLLLDKIKIEVYSVMDIEQVIRELTSLMTVFYNQMKKTGRSPAESMGDVIEIEKVKLKSGEKSLTMSREKQRSHKMIITIMEEEMNALSGVENGNECIQIIKDYHAGKIDDMNKMGQKTKKRLSNMLIFCEEVFKKEQEMVIIITELTKNAETSRFIAKYGCDEYFKHNKELLITDRQKELEKEIDSLKLKFD